MIKPGNYILDHADNELILIIDKLDHMTFDCIGFGFDPLPTIAVKTTREVDRRYNLITDIFQELDSHG